MVKRVGEAKRVELRVARSEYWLDDVARTRRKPNRCIEDIHRVLFARTSVRCVEELSRSTGKYGTASICSVISRKWASRTKRLIFTEANGRGTTNTIKIFHFLSNWKNKIWRVAPSPGTTENFFCWWYFSSFPRPYSGFIHDSTIFLSRPPQLPQQLQSRSLQQEPEVKIVNIGNRLRTNLKKLEVHFLSIFQRFVIIVEHV